ncbi:helix-turn-helix domain-containing protein [bacterium]|nr:helix-turn-helix domain-containing protein [bacterium]
MDDTLFSELVTSMKQVKSIMKGDCSPSRVHKHHKSSVIDIRKRTCLSQSKFALLIGVSLKTVQNWEQGIRTPNGAAKTLLKLIDHEPEATLRALHRNK